jgi:hypothetical protein
MTGGISPVLSESFEDVLHAVQETARGRWFLEEFTKRKQAEDSAAILAAILKLENAMSTLPNPDGQHENAVLKKAKAAISQARMQLKSLSPEGKPLSEEAQVFAKLAELSRKAFAGETEQSVRDSIGKGVEVALRLVSDLDSSLGGAEPEQKYFQQDSAIFEPAQKPDIKPPTAPVEQPKTVAAPNSENDPNRGAKLTIHRAAKSEASETDARPAEPVSESQVDDIVNRSVTPENGLTHAKPVEPEPIISTSTTPASANQKPEQRIVIIRRKPDEEIEVPLIDQAAKSSAA